MEHVSFEEEAPIINSAVPVSSNEKSTLSGLVISWGLAKTDKDAQRVLLIIAGLCILLAIFFCVLAFMPQGPSVPQSVLDANNAKLLRNSAAAQ